MNREEVFAELERMGMTRACVVYHGAHDESFIEGISLYKEWYEDGYREPDEFYEEEDAWDASDNEPETLPEALAKPLFDELGDAFGDTVEGVEGVVVWDVEKRTVRLNHRYLDWQEEEREVG